MSQDAKPVARVVRFTVRPGREAEFDQLVKSTVMPILRNEPGVMRYLCYEVDGQPRQRVFYEEYENRAACQEHEVQEHTRHFLEASEPLLEATDVYPLTLMAGGFRGPHAADHTNG
jgi:quinol monooxygenase YgiN